ncbi:hypothetical protein [Halomonas urumqiensis]|uniref:TIGR02206 family membrane protein n=1 Tax=Halomonas urumqiensis TaxID=1684789 RepID=A0A2N7UFU1_9GAMM|nr:hypothetical protein [Halomonas urumqiensis]PMR79270.1 hypothetical protein C1H70_13345 [Halomonas urumqiensis]PTB03943.1 hypothetical protein C6V82_05630 [Halomonas urumqiensis]GHE19806.1 hypothetical protein GCM10017767_03270 [Halomonas urumqiensis]
MPLDSTLPLWLKLVFTLWVLVWAPTYWWLLGPQNYLWLCNMAHFLILAGLWSDSRWLLSMQWLAVALVGTLWGVDVGVAWLTGFHPIGGTEYMFDPAHPLLTRLMSLYHLFLPLVAGFAVWRLGYERRSLYPQVLLTWVMIIASYVISDVERNVNWVHGPFGMHQELLPPLVYLGALMVAWPMVILLPVHLLMRLAQRRGWWPG